jgi:hypothetical protein
MPSTYLATSGSWPLSRLRSKATASAIVACYIRAADRAKVLVCPWHMESPLLSSRVGGVITVDIPSTETRGVSVVLKVKVLRSTHNCQCHWHSAQ